MLHKDNDYARRTNKAPNQLARDILIDTAKSACKAMGGAAQIGDSGYWFVDANEYEIAPRANRGGKK